MTAEQCVFVFSDKSGKLRGVITNPERTQIIGTLPEIPASVNSGDGSLQAWIEAEATKSGLTASSGRPAGIAFDLLKK